MVFEFIQKAVDNVVEKARLVVNGIFPKDRTDSNFAKVVKNASDVNANQIAQNAEKVFGTNFQSIPTESQDIPNLPESDQKRYRERFKKSSTLLATGAKNIDIARTGVSINFQTNKLIDENGKPAKLEEIFMPDVLTINLVDGDKNITAHRDIVDGKVGYYFYTSLVDVSPDETPDPIYLEIPVNSDSFFANIQYDNLENLTPEEVALKLAEENSILAEYVTDEANDQLNALAPVIIEEEIQKDAVKLTPAIQPVPVVRSEPVIAPKPKIDSVSKAEPEPSIKASHTSAPSPSITPSPEPIRKPQVSKKPVAVENSHSTPRPAPRMTVAPEKQVDQSIEKRIENKEIKLSASESPTGQPLYLNYPEAPELRNKPPQYFVFLHGMHGSIDETLSDFGMLDKIENLRMAGINAVLIIPQTSAPAINSQWDYLLDPQKVDAMFSYCEETVKQEALSTPTSLQVSEQVVSSESERNINLISFSGGYRAVSAILQKSSYTSRISQISMIDSIYPDDRYHTVDVLAKFIKDGGKLSAITSLEGGNTSAGAEQLKKALTTLGIDPSVFKETITNLNHKASLQNFLLPEMKTFAGLNEELNPDETFVRGTDDFGSEVILRTGAYERLQRAMNIAKSYGMKLFVFSSYRSDVTQRSLWNKKVNEISQSLGLPINHPKVRARARKRVAPPGYSPHRTGGAIDIWAIPERYKGKPRSFKQTRETKALLRNIMEEAGFERYEAEEWHFEYGTTRWAEQRKLEDTELYAGLKSLKNIEIPSAV